jgi:AcrR family transcriptional regulator
VPPPKQRTPALQARVLAVAMATLERDGVAGFTTRKVAARASTSTKAVYELFGDRAGLIREVFFEGFRELGAQLVALPPREPREELERTVLGIRSFMREHPVLATVMFSRPFVDFDPGPDESRAGAVVRETIVDRVRRFLGDDAPAGDATDLAHVLLALVQGLAAQEAAGWLGTSRASIDRRWRLALDSLLDGAPVGP